MKCSITLESDHNRGKIKMKTINAFKNSYKVGLALLSPINQCLFIDNMTEDKKKEKLIRFSVKNISH